MKCYSCNVELSDIPTSGIIGYSEECSKCRADVRVCLNCKFYDKAAYNECKEPNAERVVEKNRRNRCDYFSLSNSSSASSSTEKSKADILKELDNLFKK